METIIETHSIVFDGDVICNTAIKALTDRLIDLGEYLETDIVVINCHADRNKIPLKIDDRMHIFCMMTPVWVDTIQHSGKKKIIKINGKCIDLPPGQRDYLEPINELYACKGIYDENDNLLALAVGNGNIYVLNDFIHAQDNETLNIGIEVFEYIIDKALKII